MPEAYSQKQLQTPSIDAIEPAHPEDFLKLPASVGRIAIGYAGKKFGQELAKRVMFTTEKQLKKKFKHAKILGINGNKNPENIKKFAEALDKHVKSPNIKIIEGTYRGKKATHFFNPKTKINIIRNEQGQFWSVWKLREIRIKHLLEKGKL